MAIRLDYMGGAELTLLERRAGNLLLGWAVTLWVIAAACVLLLPITLLMELGLALSGAGADIEVAAYFLIAFFVVGVVTWRTGAALLEARQGIAWHSVLHVASGARTMWAICEVAAVLTAIGTGIAWLRGADAMTWAATAGVPALVAAAGLLSTLFVRRVKMTLEKRLAEETTVEQRGA